MHGRKTCGSGALRIRTLVCGGGGVELRANEASALSHRHIRLEKAPPPPPRIQLVFWICSGIFFVAVMSVIFWQNLRASEFWDTHSSTDGAVSETRVVFDHVGGGQYSHYFYYRLEAHVTFRAEGKDEDRWLIASEPSELRSMLAAKPAKSPHRCEVYWATGHPETARCTFH